jgi:SPP1 family predicted phage head-tail adaptor
MGIGKMDRRPTFFNETYVQDAGGGTSGVETERWDQWAEISDRSGSSFIGQSQTLETYDYTVTVRFDGRFNSNTMMIYEGQQCACSSLSVKTEGYKNFLVMRFSRTDTFSDLS